MRNRKKGLSAMIERHEAEPGQPINESSEPKKPNHRLRQAVAATALLAAAGTVYGGVRAVDSFWFEPGRERHTDEVTLIEEIRSGEREAEAENALVVLRSGVQLRETPHMAAASFGRNNVASEIRDGENVVIDHPMSYKDDVNHIWYAFSLEGSVGQLVDDEDAPAVSGNEISDNILWVNATALHGQLTTDELPYVETLFPDETSNSFVDIDSRGNFTTGDDSETPIAVAREINVDVAEFFIRSYNR